MSFKDILVHLDDTPQAAHRLDLALELAARHQAHLTALIIRGQTDLPVAMAGEFGAELGAMLAKADEEAAARVKAVVESRKPAAGVTLECRDVTGPMGRVAALHARYADLAIVGQTDPGRRDIAHLSAGELVMAVGRPVLVVPHAGQVAALPQRVLVAWNGSREATRAIHDALPLLVAASHVQVIAINPHHGFGGHGDLPGADLCRHLSRHGVTAVAEQVSTDELQVGAMLLSRAADEDADLLVMGAYGHSRLAEMVLGGATRHLLDHMTLPVLFSH
jgi:nucleotide-binding universal stress UspA family protein